LAAGPTTENMLREGAGASKSLATMWRRFPRRIVLHDPKAALPRRTVLSCACGA